MNRFLNEDRQLPWPRKQTKLARAKHFGEMSPHTRTLQKVVNAYRRGENVRDIQASCTFPNPNIERIESPLATVCILRNHLQKRAIVGRPSVRLLLALLLPIGNRGRARSPAHVLRIPWPGRCSDLLQLYARPHPLEDDKRLEHLEVHLVEQRSNISRRIRMAFLPQTSEPSSFWALTHFTAFTKPLRSSPCVRRELHGRRRVLADLRDYLDLGTPLSTTPLNRPHLSKP